MNTNKVLFIAIMLVLATTLITSTIVAIEPAQAKTKDKVIKDKNNGGSGTVSAPVIMVLSNTNVNVFG